jgi:hypothetical protein
MPLKLRKVIIHIFPFFDFLYTYNLWSTKALKNLKNLLNLTFSLK